MVAVFDYPDLFVATTMELQEFVTSLASAIKYLVIIADAGHLRYACLVWIVLRHQKLTVELVVVFVHYFTSGAEFVDAL